jgi:hypothetical protein
MGLRKRVVGQRDMEQGVCALPHCKWEASQELEWARELDSDSVLRLD